MPPRDKTILVVDDDNAITRCLSRMLRARGYTTVTAANGWDALNLLAEHHIDVVLTDIAMPGIDGIALLRLVRQQDLHLPVILVTGEPAVDTAVQALEYGALHYLTKPVPMDALERILDKAFNLIRMAQVRQQATELLGQSVALAPDRAGLEACVQRCLKTLWLAYQPIIRTADHSVVGYGASIRSEEPTMSDPDVVQYAAEQLGQLDTLGRIVRDRATGFFKHFRRSEILFLNLHVADLLDPELLSSDAPLTQVASQVILAVTERASLAQVPDVRSRVARLRQLGYRIAVDDLGAGYAGLTTFAILEPDFVKLDVSLVRGIDTIPTKQKVVRSLTTLCGEMGILVVAKGVERVEERDVLTGLGCDMLQGLHVGKPMPLECLQSESEISVAPTD